MRIEGRRPSARVDGVIAGAFENSRIIVSSFRTISPCSDASGSRIVGILLLLVSARSLGVHRSPERGRTNGHAPSLMRGWDRDGRTRMLTPNGALGARRRHARRVGGGTTA